MTQKEILEFKQSLDKAEESVVPFAVVKDDELNVVGDANETQVNPYTYKITFRIPDMSDGTVKFAEKTAEFDNVYVTPRNEMRVVKIIAQLLPYFKKINKDKVEEYTNEELLDIVASMEDEVVDGMYTLVATVLGIDPKLKDFMIARDVIAATTQIIATNPSAVNEADTFFE